MPFRDSKTVVTVMNRRRATQQPAAAAEEKYPQGFPPEFHLAPREEEGFVSLLAAEAAAVADTLSQWVQELTVR